MAPLEVFEGYLKGVDKLNQTTRVFPDPSELLLLGRKLLVNTMLNQVAKALGNDRPRHTVISETPTWEEYQTMGGDRPKLEAWKREFSDESLHVLLPFKNNRKDEESFRTMSEKEKEWIPLGLKPQWFKQPLITPLCYLGEIRSYVVQGTLYYAVHSVPNERGEQNYYSTQNVMPLSLVG